MKKVFFMACLVLFASTFLVSAQKYGDLDNNQSIDIQDALLAARYFVGIKESIDTKKADVNGDKVVDLKDALLISLYSIGLINIFPVEEIPEKPQVTAKPTAGINESSYKRELNPQVSIEEESRVVKGINQFGFDLYNIIKKTEENLFFSPLSISYAFAMCSAGAANNTKAQIIDTMNFPYNDNTLHKVYNYLDLKMATAVKKDPSLKKDDLILRIANSAWGQIGDYFVPSFIDTLAINYGSKMNLLNFAKEPEESRLIINKWVAKNTENMIEDLLPNGAIRPITSLVLVNAIYFKGFWKNQFLPKNTKDEFFYNLDGSKNKTSMMYGSEKARYYDGGNYQMMIKEYHGQMQNNAMYIILPAEGEFEKVEAQLNETMLDQARKKEFYYKVRLSLPKFKYKWSAGLENHLPGLGMKEPFKSGLADFSGIDGKRTLYISKVIHEAAVAIDENGTEASAATAILMERGFKPSSKTVIMNVNRPFFYFIRNMDTGAILFMGKVIKL